MENTIKKLTAVLCCLVLPAYVYEQVVFLFAKIFEALCLSMEAAAPGSVSARFLRNNLALLYSGSAALLCGLTMGILYLRGARRRHRPMGDSAVRPRYGWFYAGLLGCFSAVFFNLIIELSGLTKRFPASGASVTSLPGVNLFLYGLLTCLLLPLTEELIFRGFGYLRLRRSLSFRSAALASAVLFGFFHGNLPQGIYGFFMGLLLSFTAESCKALTSAVIFHICANGISFFLLGNIGAWKLSVILPVLTVSGIGGVWSFLKLKHAE